MISSIAVAIRMPHYILTITKASIVDVIPPVGYGGIDGSKFYYPSTGVSHTGMDNRSHIYPYIKIIIDHKAGGNTFVCSPCRLLAGFITLNSSCGIIIPIQMIRITVFNPIK